MDELVNAYGRVMPIDGQKVVDPNYEYFFGSDGGNYEASYIKLLGESNKRFLTYGEYISDTNRIIHRVASDPRLCNLLKGSFFRLLLPKQIFSSYSEMLDKLYLPALRDVVINKFSAEKFVLPENFLDSVSLVESSRQEYFLRLLSRNSMAAIYFPTAFYGYSYVASREMMRHLPKNLVLSGAIEVVQTLIAYPNLLQIGRSPFMDMAACQLDGHSISLGMDSLSSFKIELRDESPNPIHAGGLLVIDD